MEEQNKTEQATPHKLTEARKQGQVSKSLDCIAVFVVAGLLVALLGGAQRSWLLLAQTSQQLLEDAGRLQLSVQTAATLASAVALSALGALLPCAGIGALCAVLGNLLQTGPIFSMAAVKPKFNRLNLATGFKRLFSKKMLIEGVKSVLKLLFFATVVLVFFRSLWPELSGLANQGLQQQLQWLGQNTVALLFRLLMALTVVAILDVALSRWQYSKQMMMSKREVKEEIKRREGDPLIRAKIRELQRAALQQSRALQNVPGADVLITNPQHLAIALRYDRSSMGAPVIVAKGAERWAQQMRVLAAKHGVPQFEQRRLARALFRHGVPGRPIPIETFVDVAHIYAVLTQRERGAGRYEYAS
jgi:flagellar biosynthesis protein FlhB